MWPVALGFFEGYEMLAAWCELRRDFRHFRLDRIAAATVAVKSPGGRRTLRVCTSPSLAMKWLIPRLGGFQLLAPDVEVQLSTMGRQFIDRATAAIVHHDPMPVAQPAFRHARAHAPQPDNANFHF